MVNNCTVFLILLSVSLSFQLAHGFWSNIIKSPIKFSITKDNAIEKQLLSILESEDNQGRGQQTTIEISQQIQSLVNTLEQQQESLISNKSCPKPVESNILDGCWKLLYTSSPGTNSPIQRTFTASSKVSVYQIINLNNPSNSFLPDNLPDVSNIVCFGDKSRLRVTALASTVNRPLVEPRKGDGKILGLNIFGVSSSAPPRDPNERIDFSFQDACFEFVDYPQLTIPYPVPFKLLGDEAKGWIDITYLSPNLRISRGNKGTIFVLKKSDPSIDTSAKLAAIKSIGDMKLSPASITVSAERKKLLTSSKSIAIVFPAQLGTQDDYTELASTIESRINVPVFIPSLSRLDWPVGLLPSAFSVAYVQGNLEPKIALKFYLSKIDEAIAQGMKEYPDTKSIVLVAHSIGGWIARAWLSEWCTDEKIKSKVKLVVTLGSPHNPPPADSAMASLDQTRGLLSYINNNYPGAYEKGVKYVTVAGTAITGALPIGSTNSAIDETNSEKNASSPKLLDTFQSFLAYASYFALAGNGQAIGDGIIPVDTCKLPGAQLIELNNVKHSNYLPTPGQSIRLPFLWYGSDAIIDTWLNIIRDVVVKAAK